MYGNIGLQTAKGSGTSGYVQKSLAYINKRNYESGNYKEVLQKFKDNPALSKRKVNNEIIQHELKRKIESELYDLAESLKEQNETNIEEKIKEKRAELYKELDKRKEEYIDRTETHQQSKLKDEQMEKIRKALGVKGEYMYGSAFDLETQEQKKIETINKIKQDKERRKRIEKEKYNSKYNKRKKRSSSSYSRSDSSCSSRLSNRSRSRSRSRNNSRDNANHSRSKRK